MSTYFDNSPYYSNPIEGIGNSEIEDCLPLAYRDDANPDDQVVESTYTLDVEDIDAVQKYVTPGCLKSSTPTIKLKSGYNYTSTIASDLDVDIDAILKHISTKINIDIPSDIEDRAETANYLIESIDKSKNDKIPSQYKQILLNIDGANLSNFIFNTVLKNRLPKFIYIEKYYQMKGEENLNDLLSRQRGENGLEPLDSDLPILDFFDMADISIGDITRINSSRNMRMAMKKIQPKLESVSKEILKFWSQYVDYEIDFDIRDAKSNDPAGMNKGTNIWIQVINKNLDIDNRFRNESAGFNSFFSLYCHRKFRPLSKPRLCYNNNLLGRSIRWRTKRRRFTPEFKAEVVIEALSGESSQAELCRRHNLSADQLSKWKQQLLENAATLFESTDKQSDASIERIAQLEQLVGRLTLALEIQKKASTLLS